MSTTAHEILRASSKKPKEPTVDIEARPEPTFISYGSLDLSELLPCFLDKLKGKHTTPALRSIEAAHSLVKTALSDFKQHPELRAYGTIPEARAYMLGAMVQMMKSCGLNKDCSKALGLFKTQNSNGSDATLSNNIYTLLENKIPDNDRGVILRTVIECALDASVVSNKYKRTSVGDKTALLTSLSEKLSAVQDSL